MRRNCTEKRPIFCSNPNNARHVIQTRSMTPTVSAWSRWHGFFRRVPSSSRAAVGHMYIQKHISILYVGMMLTV